MNKLSKDICIIIDKKLEEIKGICEEIEDDINVDSIGTIFTYSKIQDKIDKIIKIIEGGKFENN